MDWLTGFFNANGFVPHGFCLLWRPSLIWTHVLSDALIAAAYFMIPLRLCVLLRKRGDFAFRGTIHLFCAFILLCGLTHVASIVMVWWPDYGVEALLKTVTAIVSIATALWMFPLIPLLLRVPSPRELEQKNLALSAAIAERDELLRELGAHRATLEATVERRTAELRTANDKLAKRNVDLAQFAFVASHDLQEPLRKIQLFMDLLRRRSADVLAADALDLVDRATAAARRLGVLVEEILSLSRVDARGVQSDAMSLRAAVDEAVDDLKDDIDEADARLVVSGEWPVVSANAALVRQLFVNLIGNALKFREPVRALRVAVDCAQDPATGDHVIEVRDNGVGLEAAQAEHVFELFNREKRSASVSGSGVGLPLCRRIVEAYGGAITATGAVDQGAVFTILWPREPGHAR